MSVLDARTGLHTQTRNDDVCMEMKCTLSCDSLCVYESAVAENVKLTLMR